MSIVKKASHEPQANNLMGEHPVIYMTAAQWIAVPDNPRQRDTESRLRKAKHLHEAAPTHSKVAVAMTPDGRMWKLDGHTRALLWSREPSLAPTSIKADVYWVSDVEEAKSLYSLFDNPNATEGATDRIFGAYRERGFHPSTGLFLRMSSALTLATGALLGTYNVPSHYSTYAMVDMWETELRTFDTIRPSRDRFRRGLAAAALVTLRRRGAGALDFWGKYQDNAGIKNSDSCDGVEALSLLMNAACNRGGSAMQWHAMGCGISAYEAFRSGRWYKVTRKGTGLGPSDPIRYLNPPRPKLTNQSSSVNARHAQRVAL